MKTTKITAEDLGSGQTRRALESLSERELEVLQLLAEYWTNREIAHQLTIAEATVASHVHRILAKLMVSDRRAAARLLAATRHSG